MNKLIKVSDKSCLVKTDKIKAFNSIRTTRPTQKRNSFKNFGQLVLSVYANSVSKYVIRFENIWNSFSLSELEDNFEFVLEDLYSELHKADLTCGKYSDTSASISLFVKKSYTTNDFNDLVIYIFPNNLKKLRARYFISTNLEEYLLPLLTYTIIKKLSTTQTSRLVMDTLTLSRHKQIGDLGSYH